MWMLENATYVREGVVLTIEPCTRMEAQGYYCHVVSRGGRIVAAGSRDQPIVFMAC